MTNAITSALSGLNTASRQVETKAESIANPTSQSQIIEDVVDIRVAETAYKANVEVIKVADELTQELIEAFDETV